MQFSFSRRGYAEAEIEAVFAKYDIDGDRVLDKTEQRKMQADLEGQKVTYWTLNSGVTVNFLTSG
jgi:hypothetical protein